MYAAFSLTIHLFMYEKWKFPGHSEYLEIDGGDTYEKDICE